jgi:hypothetical protein
MPYIIQEERKSIKTKIDSVLPDIKSVGQLNYAISLLCHNFLQDRGGVRYANINDVIGVLECAKIEVYRTIASEYEDQKKEENGPVSQYDNKKVLLG